MTAEAAAAGREGSAAAAPGEEWGKDEVGRAAPELVFADGSPLAEYVKSLGDPAVRLRTFSIADEAVDEEDEEDEEEEDDDDEGEEEGDKSGGGLAPCGDGTASQGIWREVWMCVRAPWNERRWAGAQRAFAIKAAADDDERETVTAEAEGLCRAAAAAAAYVAAATLAASCGWLALAAALLCLAAWAASAHACAEAWCEAAKRLEQFEAATEAADRTHRRALQAVKELELVARGYRLTPALPPVNRLDYRSPLPALHCKAMRTTLARSLQRHSDAVLGSGGAVDLLAAFKFGDVPTVPELKGAIGLLWDARGALGRRLAARIVPLDWNGSGGPAAVARSLLEAWCTGDALASATSTIVAAAEAERAVLRFPLAFRAERRGASAARKAAAMIASQTADPVERMHHGVRSVAARLVVMRQRTDDRQTAAEARRDALYLRGLLREAAALCDDIDRAAEAAHSETAEPHVDGGLTVAAEDVSGDSHAEPDEAARADDEKARETQAGLFEGVGLRPLPEDPLPSRAPPKSAAADAPSLATVEGPRGPTAYAMVAELEAVLRCRNPEASGLFSTPESDGEDSASAARERHAEREREDTHRPSRDAMAEAAEVMMASLFSVRRRNVGRVEETALGDSDSTEDERSQ